MAGLSREFHMKSLALALCIVVLSLCQLAIAQAPAAGQNAIAAKPDAQMSFDALKGLAGTWTGSVTTDPPNPEINGTIQVTMRVASRGNVLTHEIAPGGVPEPTVIYLDGDRLTLVHYCEAGNRPRLVAHKSADRKTVGFDFVDISGSTSPAYLHNFVFTIIDADHHTEDWTFMLPGGPQLNAHFDLKRAKESNPPSAVK
ncbi:MAG TPA: hypothetical protein VJN21_06960 [Candidatus Acidoferrales bacterium]|nr:hypothetical protein [Candidatus Acidoferrales bacterium]